jgi:hypothetical protein
LPRWEGDPMLGFRKVRDAQIENTQWRDTFEKYGEEVIRSVVSAGHSPTAVELASIYQDKHYKSAALRWLTERGDRKANHEWLITCVEVGILVFVVLGVVTEGFTLWHELTKK